MKNMKLSKLSSRFILFHLLIVHIFYIQITISQTTCQDNNYPCQGNDDNWWYSTSNIIPSDSTIYGQLKLRDSMYVQFDIINNEGIANQWENIFRIGYSATISGGCTGKGSRYPALYLGPNDDLFHFAVSDYKGGVNSNCYAGASWQFAENFGSYHMYQGVQYSATINYNESRVLVRIQDVTNNGPWETYIDTDRGGTNPLYFNSSVSIFIGTDHFAGHGAEPIANVTLSNMIIVSYWDRDSFTLPPTYAPTATPTVNPTNQPSASPTSVTSGPTTVK